MSSEASFGTLTEFLPNYTAISESAIMSHPSRHPKVPSHCRTERISGPSLPQILPVTTPDSRWLGIPTSSHSIRSRLTLHHIDLPTGYYRMLEVPLRIFSSF